MGAQSSSMSLETGGLSPSFVRANVLIDFERIAPEFGLDPRALFEEVGIASEALAHSTFPTDALARLLELAAEASGVEDFGLRFAERRGMPDLGPLMEVMSEEATVREALKTLCSLMHIHADGLFVRFEDEPEPILYIDLVANDLGPCRHTIESALVGLTEILRSLLGKGWSPALVALTLGRSASKARYERVFRCPVDSSQHFNGIVLHQSDLERPIPRSRPVRSPVENYLLKKNGASRETFLRRAMKVVAMSLSQGNAKATLVADHLGMDRRTLNRRLARHGTNFSGVIEEVRRTLSAQHLLSSDRSLSDISVLVGFESLRAFDRWFRQSFGVTPRDWRRTHKRTAEAAGPPARHDTFTPSIESRRPKFEKGSSRSLYTAHA
jgi:AraC-like DNA-binding protein